MWSWTLNWGEIDARLVIGSCPITTHDIDRLRTEAGASALLSLQHDECRAHRRIDYAEHLQHGGSIGLAMVNVPMRDFDAADQGGRLPRAVRRLARLVAEGHRVYVHCTAGINRSPLVVLGFLVFAEGLALEQALERIRRVRPEAEPYLDAYRACREDLVKRHHERTARRAYRRWEREPDMDPLAHWLHAEVEVLREAFRPDS